MMLVHGNTSSPSIEYYPADGSWFCHKCRVGGDVVALHAAKAGMSYKAAWHDLIERFGIEDTIKRRAGEGSASAGIRTRV